MKYYIDFDNTLFETPKLTKALLTLLTNAILQKHTYKEFEETFNECKKLFNRENFYNIYDLIEHFSHIYNLDKTEILNNLSILLSDTKEFLYSDAIPFLKKLKSEGHQLYILSNCKESLKYQSAKISGSGIADFFEAAFITSTPKYSLDLKYNEGIFIDDKPSDLEGLFNQHPKQVIRIARQGNKYSEKQLNIPGIKVYQSLDEIKAI